MYFLTGFQPTDRPNAKRLMEIYLPIKDSFQHQTIAHQTIPHQTIGMRYCTQLHVNSFSVGESIQGTCRDNVPKFIMYIQLILSFIEKFIQNEWNVCG